MTNLVMNNIITQKHNNTAKTETIFVSSATDTNIVVIVIVTKNRFTHKFSAHVFTS